MINMVTSNFTFLTFCYNLLQAVKLSSIFNSLLTSFTDFILALIFICSFSYKSQSKYFKVKIITTFLLTSFRERLLK